MSYNEIMLSGGDQVLLSQSIIEARQSLATPIKQHFVEWFSGDAIDSIWNQSIITGASSSFGMVDAIDEGFQQTNDATASAQIHWNFNGIQHYSNTGSKFIAVVRRVNSSANTVFMGLSASTTSNDFVLIENDSAQTFYRLRNKDASTGADVATTKNVDTSWHRHEVSILSTYSKCYIDDTFEAVNTSNRPTVGLNPRFHIQGANTEGRIRYFEVMNL